MRSVLVAWVCAAAVFVSYLSAQSATYHDYIIKQSPRDIIFTGGASCKTNIVGCANEIHFNGDWTGVKLCRANTCVRYEEVFSAKRH